MSFRIHSSLTLGGALSLAGAGFVRFLLGVALAGVVPHARAEPSHGDRGGRGMQVGGTHDFRSFDDRLPWQRRASGRDQDNDPDYQPAPVRPAAIAEPAAKRDTKPEVRPEPRYNSVPAAGASGAAAGTGRLTEEERRKLRQSIQDAGREVYRPKP